MEAVAIRRPTTATARRARYDDVAALMYPFKYQLNPAPMMGQWMAWAGRGLLQDADALIPVPLHWRRLWSRRFNQSAALAKGIACVSGVPVLHEALKRVRPTAQQVGLSRTECVDNVQGAFPVPNKS